MQEWLARPDCRISLHFIPSQCPHLNPIERLWGVIHRNVIHNKCYATVAQFADATLGFLRENVPRNWATMCDSITDNFHVIRLSDFSGHDVNRIIGKNEIFTPTIFMLGRRGIPSHIACYMGAGLSHASHHRYSESRCRQMVADYQGVGHQGRMKRDVPVWVQAARQHADP